MHIYFNIKLHENKSGHYEHIYFNIKLHENKSGHYCNLGNDWNSYRVPIFLPLRPALSILFLDKNLASSSVPRCVHLSEIGIN